MKQRILILCLALSLWSINAHAACDAAYEGFGATEGGEGQTVYTVTSLADSGAGTLRNGIASNRCIEFSVGGTITLLSKLTLANIDNLTIDGFTAPSPGITLANRGIRLNGQTSPVTDIVIRGIRVRMDGCSGCSKDNDDDGIQMHYAGVNRVVIDHVSISGAADENLSISPHVTNVTVQWSIFAHPAGGAGTRGVLVLGGNGVTMHHNILTRAHERLPMNDWNQTDGGISPLTTLDYRNNLNGLDEASFGPLIRNGSKANLVNNYFVPVNYLTGGGGFDVYATYNSLITVCQQTAPAGVGTSNPEFEECKRNQPNYQAVAYVAGNVADPSFTGTGVDLNAWGTTGIAFSAPAITGITSACTAAFDVKAGAGARGPAFGLDSIDTAIMAEISDTTIGTCGGGAPPPPGGGTTWLATENFDSYTDGVSLSTQNGGTNWSAAWSQTTANITTQDAPSGMTGNAARITADPDAAYVRTFAELRAGYCEFKFHLTALTPGAETTILLGNASGGVMNINVAGDGNLKMYDGSINSFFTIGPYSINTTHTVTINFDNDLQPNRYRVRLDAGTWTNWKIVTSDTYTTVDRFRIDSGGYTGNFYIDDIEAGAETPPAEGTITLTAPNGGEKWYVGQTKNITWSCVGTPCGSPMKVEVSRDGGTTYSTITASTADDGVYEWVVTVPASQSIKTRVCSVGSPLICGTSFNNNIVEGTYLKIR